MVERNLNVLIHPLSKKKTLATYNMVKQDQNIVKGYKTIAPFTKAFKPICSKQYAINIVSIYRSVSRT